jgi:hypothetical protein
MSEIDRNRLTEKFPKSAIRQREAVRGGKKLDYVEGHTVIHRLNDAVKEWDFAIRDINTSVIGKDQQGNDIILLRAHVALSIPGMGTREHVGVQAVRQNSGEDLIKGAVTDALKKAATLFGVGLELYGPDYEDHLPTVWDEEANSETRLAPPPAKPKPAPRVSRTDNEDGTTPGGASRKSYNWLCGIVKDLGHVVQDDKGSTHHDDAWLLQTAYERIFVGETILHSEDLNQAQVSQLIDLLKPKNGTPEQHPGISPERYQHPKERQQQPPAQMEDWSAFWTFARSHAVTNAQEFSRITGRDGMKGLNPASARDLLMQAFERPHLVNNQVG